jgi:hypothetical protein
MRHTVVADTHSEPWLLAQGMGGMGGGMPGGAGGAGGTPGGMGGMGGMGDMLQKMMSNPKAMELMQKAQSNPKVRLPSSTASLHADGTAKRPRLAC